MSTIVPAYDIANRATISATSRNSDFATFDAAFATTHKTTHYATFFTTTCYSKYFTYYATTLFPIVSSNSTPLKHPVSPASVLSIGNAIMSSHYSAFTAAVFSAFKETIQSANPIADETTQSTANSSTNASAKSTTNSVALIATYQATICPTYHLSHESTIIDANLVARYRSYKYSQPSTILLPNWRPIAAAFFISFSTTIINTLLSACATTYESTFSIANVST